MDPAFKRLTLQQLHGNKVPAVILSDFVNGADIWVVQRRRRARFALKPLQRKRIFFRLGGQELERDMPTEVDVLGFVDHSHSSAAQLRQDTVVRDSLADHSGEHSWE